MQPKKRSALGNKIFLSYAHEDFGRAQQLYQKLKNAGFEPWMDKPDLLPGQAWQPALNQAVRTADFFIACLSVHSVRKRGFVQREIRQALDIWQEKLVDDIYLIPVRFDDCEIPQPLAHFQWIDLLDFAGEAWERLLRTLRAESNRTTVGQAPPPPVQPPSYRTMEPAALCMARRSLEILDQQASGYTRLTIPAHLQIELEDKRREVAELERRWRES